MYVRGAERAGYLYWALADHYQQVGIESTQVFNCLCVRVAMGFKLS